MHSCQTIGLRPPVLRLQAELGPGLNCNAMVAAGGAKCAPLVAMRTMLVDLVGLSRRFAPFVQSTAQPLREKSPHDHH